jgi:hypothetical protein
MTERELCAGSGTIPEEVEGEHAGCTECSAPMVPLDKSGKLVQHTPWLATYPQGAADHSEPSDANAEHLVAAAQGLHVGQCFTAPSGLVVQLRKRIPHADWDKAHKDRWELQPVQYVYQFNSGVRWYGDDEPCVEVWADYELKHYTPRADLAPHHQQGSGRVYQG